MQDLSFQLDCDAFKWRWEVTTMWPKAAAKVLSRHLIIPALGACGMFSASNPVSTLTAEDLEKVNHLETCMQFDLISPRLEYRQKLSSCPSISVQLYQEYCVKTCRVHVYRSHYGKYFRNRIILAYESFELAIEF